MKRFFTMLATVSAMVLAGLALAVSSASAATFTWSETGELKGTQTSNQVFTTGGGGAVTCKKAASSGTIVSKEGASQDVSVNYADCSAFGFTSATVSKAEYRLHANGEVDVLNKITITVPLAFCSVTVEPQSGLKSVSYTNTSGKIEQHSAVEGIKSTHSGGLCSSGENGTYTGSNLVELVGDGSIAWDAATFTWSETGELKGAATSNQVFTTTGSSAVTCKKAATSGEIVSMEGASQDVSVSYSDCSAFGFASALVSKADYRLHANGEIDVLNKITITVPLGFCSVTVEPQSGLKSVSYTNTSGKIEQHSAVEGIKSTHSGGLCSSGENGTYTGSNLVELVGGGSIAWDA